MIATTIPYIEKAEPLLIPIIKPAEKPPDSPKLYTIKPGDSLISIAEAQHTTKERLFDKNTSITNPDVISAGDTLTIPTNDEVLSHRDMISSGISPALGTANYGGSSNLYSYGYCTWYAKNMRPDMPNNLGNADTWYDRAAAQGFGHGSVPQVGAVAVAIGYMHVAIVTAVDNGMVTVSEMNYEGWNVVSTRTAPASEFQYIY